jgi:PAS domain S-box-containing protein
VISQDVLDALVSHVAVLDHTGTVVAVNAAWRSFAEANAALDTDPHRRTGIGTSYLDICRLAAGPSSEQGAEVAAGITAVIGGTRPRYELDYPCPAPGVPRWFRLRVTPLSADGARGCLVEHVDITDRAMSNALVTAQGQVLEAVATGRPLSEVLAQIVDLVETQLPDALCSILLFESSTLRLRFAAGQYLPAAYNQAVDGIQIGPTVGSCGTAAFRKAPVDVVDIATDPLWADYRDLALAHGLRACLSIPVLASGNVAGLPRGEVLATFAIYHREPRSPIARADRSRGVLGLTAAHLVSVAIERDRAEAALRSSEARLRAIVDHSPALIFLKDPAGRPVLINRQLAELRGSDQLTSALLPAAAEAFAEGHRAVVATHDVDQREEEVVLQDRRLRLLSVQFPLFDAEGGLSGVCGISTDITSRVRAEAERDQLWAHSPDPVCIAALDATLLDVNAEWTRRFGWTAAELRGRPIDGLAHPDDVPSTQAALATLRRGEPLRGFEHRFRGRDGSYRLLSWNALPLLDAGRWYGFVRDITEERQLQEQLRQSQKLEAIGAARGRRRARLQQPAHDDPRATSGLTSRRAPREPRLRAPAGDRASVSAREPR